MRRILIGATTSLAVWLGSALAAEAQGTGITPTGPLAVQVTDLTEVYTCTVTTNYSFLARLTVYNNGTAVYGNQWYCVNSGPAFYFVSPTLSTADWGLAVGNTVDFHFVAQFGLAFHWVSDYNLTVQPGSTSMLPRLDSACMMAAALPGRKDRDIDELLSDADEVVA
jgi:hypothetical protein